MKPILDKTNPWELNALFIQPTPFCARNCKGCYVKEYKDTYTSYTVLLEVFTKFYLNKEVKYGTAQKAWANQITISVDDLPKDSYQKNMMGIFFSEICKTLSYYRNNRFPYPEVHLTTHTIDTLAKYYRDFNTAPSVMWRDLKYFNMVSISEISDKDIPKVQELKNSLKDNYSQTSINFNHLLPNNITSLNVNEYVDHIARVGEVVDSIYLVMFKRAMGLPENNLTQLGDKSRMMNDIRLIKTLQERLPERIKEKLHVDGCLQDTRNHRKTGFGCSSNVSRVQIWPDGSVSGCAYAVKGHTKNGERAEDIMDNISECRKRYDFKDICRLPKVYDSICK